MMKTTSSISRCVGFTGANSGATGLLYKAGCASLLACAALLTLAASPVFASPILPATAIMGVNAGGASTATLGTPFSQQTPVNLNDGNLSTYDTTCCGTTGSPFPDSYVGLDFASKIGPGAGQLQVNVTFQTFGDGGWFGTGDYSPNPIAPSLVTPALQITTDGINWTTVPSSSNYLTVMGGLSPGQRSGDVTFTDLSAGAGIEGVRLIGTHGGFQVGNNGFLGVNEINASLPEPSSVVMLVIGAVGMLGWVANRKRSLRRSA